MPINQVLMELNKSIIVAFLQRELLAKVLKCSLRINRMNNQTKLSEF